MQVQASRPYVHYCRVVAQVVHLCLPTLYLSQWPASRLPGLAVPVELTVGKYGSVQYVRITVQQAAGTLPHTCLAFLKTKKDTLPTGSTCPACLA